MSEPSALGGKSCGETATLDGLLAVLQGSEMLLQVAKGVCIAARALDRPQLSCRRTSGRRAPLRHALLATLRRITRLLFIVVPRHARVRSWCALRWRLLLLRWSSVSIVARRGSWRAPGQTRKAVSVEHVGWRCAGRGSRFFVETKLCGHV
jgi:hypothetical protein